MNAPAKQLQTREELTTLLINKGMTSRNSERVISLYCGLGKYWVQAGRVPDQSALLTMAMSINDDLEDWIDGELIESSLKSLRTKSQSLPKCAQIVDECKAQKFSKEAQKKIPALLFDDGDIYGAIVSMRLGLCPPNPSDWEKEMAENPVTERELQSVRKILQGKKDLRKHWNESSKSPYKGML